MSVPALPPSLQRWLPLATVATLAVGDKVRFTADKLLGAHHIRDSRRGGGSLLEELQRNLIITHAVCVGMTGSGKTGLVTVLIEEALRALD